MLQEDFDEIVTLVLRGNAGQDKKQREEEERESMVTFVCYSSHSLNNNKIFPLSTVACKTSKEHVQQTLEHFIRGNVCGRFLWAF